MRALFATAQQPHTRDIFLNQKILPLEKLITQQEGILAYKVASNDKIISLIQQDMLTYFFCHNVYVLI